MQQLQNASEARRCAREVLEALMVVLTQLRESAARRPRPKGLSLIQLRAMGVVKKVPGARLSTVSVHLALTLSATSRLIDGLVARGYIARHVPAENRRIVSLALTPKGSRVMDAAMRDAEMELAQKFAEWTGGDRQSLCRAMGMLKGAVESGKGQGSTP